MNKKYEKITQSDIDSMIKKYEKIHEDACKALQFAIDLSNAKAF